MKGLDNIARLERTALRRFSDGILDVVAGGLLFGFGASLDLGRPHLFIVYVPILLLGVRSLLVWPRVGYARTTRRVRAEDTGAAIACLVLALATAFALGVVRSTGVEAEGGWPDAIRLVSVAVIWALAGFLAWTAHRRDANRFYGFALAIAAAFALGPLVGLQARAWALALLGLAFIAVGALRLRALRTANPPLAEGDLGGP